MPDKATVTLKLLLKSVGMEATTKQVEALKNKLGATTKAIDKTTAATKRLGSGSNKMKRNLEGAAQRSGSTAKDFSRMQQGMGGMVQVYATVAANVFALSSAFLVLRRAADLSSMMKSSEDFSNRFGVSVTEITKKMQEASGGALDFADALPTVNKAVSAGVGIGQMEELTKAATKAAQTFGGSTTEALNRFISASQRGRVEIIQTLGVVIKTEQAYKEYAASIGKTALELSAFDRQQAILNATIEASQSVFAGVNIDPNPFQQFLTTMVDLKNEMLTFATDGMTPALNAFNKSKTAALALITVLSIIVGKKFFPQLSQGVGKFAASGRESTLRAREIAGRASRAATKAQEEAEKTRGGKGIKNIKKQEMAFRKSLGTRIKLHKDFTNKIFNQQNQLNAKVLTMQRAAISREVAARAKGKGQQAVFEGISTTQLKRIQHAYNQIGLSIEKANIAQNKLALSSKATSNIIIAGFKRSIAAVSGFRSSLIGAGSALKTGFAQGFKIAEGQVAKSFKGMGVAWKIFVRDIVTGGAVIKSGTRRSVSHLTNFSKAFGRTVGILSGSFAKLLSLGSSLLLIGSLLKLGWELYGDRIKGITKDQRELLDSFKDLGNSFKDITNLNDNFIASMNNGPETLSNFIAEAEFLRGTFDSMTVAVNDFNAAIFRASGKRTIEELSTFITEMEQFSDKLTADINKSITDQPIRYGGPGGFGAPPKQYQQAAAYVDRDIQVARDALNKSIDAFRLQLGEVIQESTPALIKNISSTLLLFSETGLEGYSEQLKSGIIEKFKEIGEEGDALAGALKGNQFVALQFLISNLSEEKASAALKAIAEGSKEAAKEGLALAGNFVASGKALQETNRNMGTYIQGLEKARAASVPNKGVFNLLLDAQRSLTDLDASAKKGTKKKLEALLKAEDLTNLKKFINITKDMNFDKALALVNEELKKYDLVIQDSILNTGRFKVIQNEVARLKAEEVSTDNRRIDIIKELNQLTIDKATLDKNTAQHKLNVAWIDEMRLRRLKEIDTYEFAATVAKRKQLQAEVIAHKNIITTLEANKDAHREILKTMKQRLVTAIKLRSLENQSLKIQSTLSETALKSLKFQRAVYNNRKEILNLEISKYTIDLQSLNINKLSTEQDLQQLWILTQEIRLRQLKLQLIEREQLSTDARIAELPSAEGGPGLGIFSEEGLAKAAKFFYLKLSEETKKLKSTFEILGQGFADIILSTFDTAVDNLLEGGKKFGHVLKEALKASLREVIGNVLKKNIKDAVTGLLFLFESPKAKAERIRKENELTELEKQVSLLYQIELNTRKEGVALKPGFLRVKPEDESKKGQNPTLEAISGILEEGNKRADDFREMMYGNISIFEDSLDDTIFATAQVKEELTKNATAEVESFEGLGISIKETTEANTTTITTALGTQTTAIVQAVTAAQAAAATHEGTIATDNVLGISETTPGDPSFNMTAVDNAISSMGQSNTITPPILPEVQGSTEGDNSKETGAAVAAALGDTTLSTQDTENAQLFNFIKSGSSLVESAVFGNTSSIEGGIITQTFALIKAWIAMRQAEVAQNAASSAAATAANGAIFQGGLSNITPLADGAVVSSPSMAIIAEGKNAEAVVPLPNNREIPVDLKGAGGDTINIEQNFDFTNAGPDTVAQLRMEARAMEERTFNRVFNEINKGGRYAKMTGRR